jgi:hypothetical protein
MVPVVVPFIAMETPGRGSPSVETTVPLINRSWPKSVAEKQKIAAKSQIDLLMYFLIFLNIY